MKANPVIEVQDLSVAYPIYASARDLAVEMLTGRQRHDTFWALKNVSFAIQEKQRVGIIGANGSGKTTLLKAITGNIKPTSGSIRVDGKISAMLNLVSTLNPQETGISNIRFNLILNGCDPKLVPELTEEIIEFTELGAFMYAPVRTYSSGMNAKLAFAISTAIQPEILLVDEVLSVGDAYFVGKATRRMIDLCNAGKSLLFVSHSTGAIQMLCDTVLWMDNGAVRQFGPAEQVLKQYEEDYRRHQDETLAEGNVRRKAASTHVPSPLEVDAVGGLRLRFTGAGGRLEDTYYVRKIAIAAGGVPEQAVALDLVDGADPARPRLDVLGSEWGRLYVKDGSECRVLSSQSGRSRGGHLTCGAPEDGAGAPAELTLRAEFTSLSNRAPLQIEFLNLKSGRWEPAGAASVAALGDGWSELRGTIRPEKVSAAEFADALRRIERESRSDIEILDVRVEQQGTAAHTVRERSPFSIAVRIRANRRVARADVGIKIMRADGIYVFWQSSGMGAGNLENAEGEFEVRFEFGDNPIAAGEYLVTAYCTNGWDFPANYPYSEVFDRKVGACKFTVLRETPELDFGLVNARVAVSYRKAGDAG